VSAPAIAVDPALGKLILLRADKRPVGAWRDAPEPNPGAIARHVASGGLLGLALAPGVVCLDLDLESDDVDPDEATYEVAALGLLPPDWPSLWSQTTRSGGRHWLLRVPPELDLRQRTVIARAPDGRWSLDVRVGGKGYIVLWRHDPPRLVDLLDAPPALLARLTADPPCAATPEITGEVALGDTGPARLPLDDLEPDDRLTCLRDMLRVIDPPEVGVGRYEYWRDVGWALADAAQRWPELADSIAELFVAWSRSVPSAPDETELRRWWREFTTPRRPDGRRVGVGTLVWFAQLAGWSLADAVAAARARAQHRARTTSAPLDDDDDDADAPAADEPDDPALDPEILRALDAINDLAQSRGIVLATDAVSKTQIIRRLVPTADGWTVAVEPLWDPNGWEPYQTSHEALVRSLLGGQPRLRSSVVRDAIAIAFLRNTIDMPREWIDSLTWDGVPRLDDWLVRIGVADTAEARWGGRLLVTTIVALQYHPGSKVDEHLVLVGPGGSGKTLLGRILVPTPQWLVEGFDVRALLHDTRRVAEATYRAILVELAELNNADVRCHNALKMWMTTPQIVLRKAYDRSPVEIARRYALYATTNSPESVYAMGDGARRFVVVEVDTRRLRRRIGARPMLDLLWLRSVRDQLFAEAAYWLRSHGYGPSGSPGWWYGLQEYYPNVYRTVDEQRLRHTAKTKYNLVAEALVRALPPTHFVTATWIVERLGWANPFDHDTLLTEARRLRDACREVGLEVHRGNDGHWRICHDFPRRARRCGVATDKAVSADLLAQLRNVFTPHDNEEEYFGDDDDDANDVGSENTE
jgi:hypothetical protein